MSGLPVAGDLVIGLDEKRDLKVLDARTLEVKARARRFSVACVDGESIFGWGTEAGQPKGSVKFRLLHDGFVADTICAGRHVIGTYVVEVRAWDVDTGRRTWEWISDPRRVDSGSGNSIRTNLCSDGERVYFGLRDGTIRALAVETGKEVWRTVLVKDPDPKGSDSDRYQERWEPRGSGCVLNGLVYFHSADRVVARDAERGRHLWESKAYCVAGGQLHRHSYHCLGLSGEYEILDEQTGRRRFKTNLVEEVPSNFQTGGMPTFGPMVVSDTHMFCGYGIGYLLAFERKTGKLVWHKRATPALSFHQDNYFQIVNGRLYTGDYGTMRIYEEVNATDPVLIKQRESLKATIMPRRSARLPSSHKGRTSRVPARPARTKAGKGNV